MNKLSLILEVLVFQCLCVVMIIQVGIAKTAKILRKFLSHVFNLQEMHTTRVVLIFSQSWSSHGLEVSDTDDRDGQPRS